MSERVKTWLVLALIITTALFISWIVNAETFDFETDWILIVFLPIMGLFFKWCNIASFLHGKKYIQPKIKK